MLVKYRKNRIFEIDNNYHRHFNKNYFTATFS